MIKMAMIEIVRLILILVEIRREIILRIIGNRRSDILRL